MVSSNVEHRFETFPFPEPTDAQRGEIAAAAKQLDTPRNNWLNPPEWVREEVLEFPGSVDGPWGRYIDGARDEGRGASEGQSTKDEGRSTKDTENSKSEIPNPKSEFGLVRYPRLVPKDDDCAKLLKKRMLTNLYNERPTWLDLAHQKLDAAVFAAYGWPDDMADEALLVKLLGLSSKAKWVEIPGKTLNRSNNFDTISSCVVKVRPPTSARRCCHVDHPWTIRSRQRFL